MKRSGNKKFTLIISTKVRIFLFLNLDQAPIPCSCAQENQEFIIKINFSTTPYSSTYRPSGNWVFVKCWELFFSIQKPNCFPKSPKQTWPNFSEIASAKNYMKPSLKTILKRCGASLVKRYRQRGVANASKTLIFPAW